MINEIDIDIPVEKFCTLRQACEYLAFNWKPVTEIYDTYLGRKRYRPNAAQPTSFYEGMKKAENTLAVLIEQNKLTVTGIEDPAFPLDPFDEFNFITQEDIDKIHQKYNYNPKTFNTRTKVKTMYPWHLDLQENWVMNIGSHCSYREIQIPFAELEALVKRATPKRHYTTQLNDNGELFVTDGTITCKIANLRPNNKKYQWLKFYFDHPNQKITKEMMTVAFKDTDFEFQDGDRMTNVVHTTFDGNTGIMHACFPVLSDREIVCQPEFTDLDIQH